MTVAGMFLKGSIRGDDNLDSYIQKGIYEVYGVNTGDSALPTVIYGLLEVRVGPDGIGDAITQVLSLQEYEKSYTYYRAYWDGAWRDWARLDNFGYNTLEELAAALKPLLGL